MINIAWVFKDVSLYIYTFFLIAGMSIINNVVFDVKRRKMLLVLMIPFIISLSLTFYFHFEHNITLLLLYVYVFGWFLSERTVRKINIVDESFSYTSVIIGLGISVATVIFKGITWDVLVFTINAVGLGILITRFKTSSIVPDILLGSGFLWVLFPEELGTTFYSLVYSVAIYFIINELMIKTRISQGVDKVKISRGYLYIAIFMSIIIIFAFSFINLYISVTSYEPTAERLNEILESYTNLLGNIFTTYGSVRDFEKYTTPEFKPSFVKKVLLVKDGKVIFPEEYEGIALDEIQIEGYEFYIKKPKDANVEIVLLYRMPSRDFMRRFFISVLISAIVVLVGVMVLVNVLYKRWLTVLEAEIMDKTQEVTAANQELTAMNEELLSMNEKIEQMYQHLSLLNAKVLDFLNFIKNVDIREDTDKVFHKVYEVISDIIRVKPVGYEVLDKVSGIVYVSYMTDQGVFSQDFGVGDYILRVFYPEVISFSEDENRFAEMVIEISEILITAHDNYIALEKSKRFLSRILNVLNKILETDERKQLEEILLRYGHQLFDDVTVVAIAWKGELSENKILVKVLIKGKDIYEVKRLGSGIIKYALTTGEKYIVKNTDEDRVFYKAIDESKSAVAIPLKTKGKVLGVFEIERATINAFSEEDLRILNIFASIVAITLQRIEYYTTLKKTFFGIVEALSYTVELKDPYTHGHSRRVADYSVEIAKELRLPEEMIERIELSALLHDIGKIGIRGLILNKPSKLTHEEFEEIKKHPVLGCEIIEKVESLKTIAKIVRHHHERCDGKGYPDGLKCDEIPLESKIIAIADAFDAMTSDRPYRKALSVSKALKILEEGKGRQWDPMIVDVAIQVFRRLFKEKLEDDGNHSEE